MYIIFKNKCTFTVSENLLDMRKEDLETLKLSDIKSNSEYMIKNFVASNNDKDPLGLHFSFDQPFMFDGVVFGICIKGEAKIKIAFKEYVVAKNSLITILPGHILEMTEQSEDFFIEILAFSDRFIADMPLPRDIQILKEISLNPILMIQEEDIDKLLRYHSFIIDVFNTRKQSPYLEEMVKGLLYALMMELATLYQENSPSIKKKNSRYEELTEQFFRMLFENYKEERTASFYANKMFLTPKHLSYVLKEITGKSFNTWMDEAVVIGAKSLLKSSSYTVLQISEELNFPTASYFGRFFKRITGMTPLEYRDN